MNPSICLKIDSGIQSGCSSLLGKGFGLSIPIVLQVFTVSIIVNTEPEVCFMISHPLGRMVLSKNPSLQTAPVIPVTKLRYVGTSRKDQNAFSESRFEKSFKFQAIFSLQLYYLVPICPRSARTS